MSTEATIPVSANKMKDKQDHQLEIRTEPQESCLVRKISRCVSMNSHKFQE